MSHASTPRTRFDLDRDAFAALLADQPRFRSDQVWQGLYDHFTPLEQISNLPGALRTQLSTDLPAALQEVTRSVTDDGPAPDCPTTKWLWRLSDGSQVETVLMLYPKRATVCVSSQAGCAMACTFCATGQAGYDRNLTVGEIVEQVVRAAREAAPRRLSNVVFMGMGEPLANVDNTWDSIKRINQDIGLGARSITLSTVGLVPGIRRITEFDLPVTLAVSLHAANDELRSSMIPINKRYPLDQLADSLIAYRSAKGRRVTFEWAMIADTNDRDQDAHELAELARRVRAHVNLIPLNPTPGYPVLGTQPQRIAEFVELLSGEGVNATVRNTRGAEIDAACGQLAFREQQKHAGSSVDVPLTALSLRD